MATRENPLKVITIDFYVIGVQADEELNLSDYLSNLVERGGSGNIYERQSYAFELRHVSQHGDLFHGEFAKFRKDLIPHIGQPGGQEREIELAEHDGLLEKNHFIYRPDDNLLIYQVNGHGSRESAFAEYITSETGVTMVLNPIIQRDAIERLLNGDTVPTGLNLTFARPTNPAMYPEDDFSRNLLGMLDEVGGASVSLRVSSYKSASDADRKTLRARAKTLASAFARSSIIKSAKVNVIRDGIEHPIDLVADRVRSKQDVTMAGKYPLKASMFEALETAFHEQREVIYEVLGNPDERTG